MLYILTGLPYAGKTTLTTELVDRFGFNIVSTDNIIDDKVFEVKDMTQKDWNVVYTEAYEQLKHFLSHSKDVIFDSANLKKSERNTAKEIATNCNTECLVIYLNTSKSEILARWSKNQQTNDRSHVNEKVLDNALALFEEPTTDENVVLFNASMDLNQWIQKNITS
ncbi:MAG: ATP-binding protein [Thermodesulfobacteriota bacterium]